MSPILKSGLEYNFSHIQDLNKSSPLQWVIVENVTEKKKKKSLLESQLNNL